MPFDDDARPEMPPVPLSIAPTREQRAAWREAARGEDLHAWMLRSLDEAASAHASARGSLALLARAHLRQLRTRE